MVIHLDRPFDLPAGTSPASIITQVYGENTPQYEPFIWRLRDGSHCFVNDGTGVGGNFHAGVDYALNLGTPLKAPAAGTVIAAGWDTTGFGNKVEIRHGDIYTLYGHLQRIDCRQGQQLARGQVFGTVGSTGNSTGPHLHWAVYRIVNGVARYLDPAPFVQAKGDGIRQVSFSVTPQQDGYPVRVFDGPSSKKKVLRTVAPGTSLACNGWTYGEPRFDRTTRQQDARWYRLKDGGWVASARVLGNPPGSTPFP